MNNSLISSLVGMQSMQKKIDNIANNIANINTTGFKSSELYFQDIMAGKLIQPNEFLLEGRKTSLGIEQGFGVRNSAVMVDYSQGTAMQTGVLTDLMLSGENIFFTVLENGGDVYESTDWRYMRNGHFQMDGFGFLVNDLGEFLLSEDGDMLQIPTGATFSVDERGLVSAIYPDGEIEEIGSLKITKFNNPQILESMGNSKYRIPDEFNTGWFDLIDSEFSLSNNLDGAYSVVQGSLEASNTDLTTQLTNLNIAQRAYQLMSDGVSISNQMMSITNKIKG